MKRSEINFKLCDENTYFRNVMYECTYKQLHTKLVSNLYNYITNSLYEQLYVNIENNLITDTWDKL